jgi:hypothetical protein
MNKEEKVVKVCSKEEEKRKRNRESSKRSSEKKKEQLQKLKQEEKEWKAKCDKLRQTIKIFENGELDSKNLYSPPLLVSIDGEDQTCSSKATSTVKDIKSKSKYRNRYEPEEQMSKDQEKKWLEEERKRRNKEAAVRSRIKRQEELQKLKKEVKYLKREHDLLKKRKNDLEKESAHSSKNRDSISYVSTSGSGEHGNVQSFATNNIWMQHGCPSPKSVPDYRADVQCGGDNNMKVAFLKNKTWSRIEMELMNDSKIHSFAVRDEDGIPMCNEEQRHPFPVTLDSPSCTNSRNVLLTTEQQRQQDTSSARMKHDITTRVQSIDNRTKEQCDRDFCMKITQLRKRRIESSYNRSSFKKTRSINSEN